MDSSMEVPNRRPMVVVEDHLYHIDRLLELLRERDPALLQRVCVVCLDRAGPDTQAAAERWATDFPQVQFVVDADPANNAANWQWVAGCGADSSPWVRVFNPVLQSKKFDPDAAYLKSWLPELAKLPKSHIHAPWEAPQSTLARPCGMTAEIS